MTGHLIHIGCPKTGSNFLRRWFAAHPQLGYAEGGIAGYCDVHEIARQGAARPRQLLYRVTSSEGLASPDRHVGLERVDHRQVREIPVAEGRAQVCATLASLFPEAHVLIVTRGFRSMILSAYSQYVRTGGEDPLDLYCRIEAGDARQQSWDVDHLIALYRTAFPGRVITLPYELLRDDPARFTGALAERLGILPCEPPAERPNVSLTPVELAWYPRLTRAVRALPVGKRLRRRIEDRYLRLAQANRLAGLVATLQRWRPKEPVSDAALREETIRSAWGPAETLRGDPLYAPYAGDYLL